MVSSLQTIRTFVAVDFDTDGKQQLAAVQQELIAAGSQSGIRWVVPANFHLTLFHLGATPTALLGRIEAVLAAAVHGHGALQLSCAGVGSFPAQGEPRVLYLALAPPLEQLHALQQSVTTALNELDFHADFKVWQPHVTLGKRSGSRGVREPAWWHQMQQLSLPLPAPVAVEELCLFQSLMQQGQTSYARLAQFMLE